MLGDMLRRIIGAANAAGVDSILFLREGPEPRGHGATYTASSLPQAQGLILQ